VTVTTPNVPAGDYYLILRVDHNNVLYEADETNNQAVVPITITP
jgi:subtilase family serine protease